MQTDTDTLLREVAHLRGENEVLRRQLFLPRVSWNAGQLSTEGGTARALALGQWYTVAVWTDVPWEDRTRIAALPETVFLRLNAQIRVWLQAALDAHATP